MLLPDFDPLIAEWFSGKFGQPTEPQIAGWREIDTGHDVLISAPTGSGKTLAAFLICLDGLVRAARAWHSGGRDACGLRLSAQGALERRAEKPGAAAG